MGLGPVKYKVLKQTNPRLDVSRVRSLKALYYGGCRLLGDDAVLSQLLPRYTYEKDLVYAERKKRAYYENVFAQVINFISAGLAQDPVSLTDPSAGDEYWTDIFSDATPFSEDGSKKKTMDQVVRDAVVEALVCGWSWIQADLPARSEEEVGPSSLLEQEAQGGLRSYLVPWSTECVVDWEEKNGRLEWVRTYQCDVVANSPTEPRETKVHKWVIWERDTWTMYEFIQQKNTPPLGDEHVLTATATGNHSFGRVPWTRLDLCSDEGVRLHLGDQLESLCRAYFNRQNGEAFQWVQYYFQQLYEFLAPEISGIDTPVSDAQTDPGRAKRFRAPGEVQVRGSQDKAMFVGPNMSGAGEARQASQDLRDAIYRATAQMALSQDTSGAMLRRSADSKRQDAVAQEIVLGALGKKALTLANNVAELLAVGRGDAEPPALRGYERFDIFDVDMMLNRASVVASIEIPSATYQVEHLYQVAVADLGDSVNEDVKKQIREELEGSITQDQFMGGGGEESFGDEEFDGYEEPDFDDEDLDDDDDGSTDWEADMLDMLGSDFADEED